MNNTITNLGDAYVNGNLYAEKNLIYINYAEIGNGITENISGIEITRGTKPNVQILFDETLPFYNTTTNSMSHGVFNFTDVNNNNIGVNTNSITTTNSNLNLLGSGTNYITVKGTTSYQNQILNYSSTGVSIGNDPDAIPNIQAVFDIINNKVSTIQSTKIFQNNTKVETIDNSTSKQITITINNIQIGSFDKNGLNVDNILSPTNLTISSPNINVNGGNINLNNNKIINVKNPVNNQDVATKLYVDNSIISHSGTGNITFSDNNINNTIGNIILNPSNSVDIISTSDSSSISSGSLIISGGVGIAKNLTANSAVINGGWINNVIIGNTNPTTATFTSMITNVFDNSPSLSWFSENTLKCMTRAGIKR